MASLVNDRFAGVTGNLGVKDPVSCMTTGNIALSSTQLVDGVGAVSGTRVLVANQTNAIDNGIWNSNSGAWSRALDFDSAQDLARGTLIYVTGGVINGNAFYTVTSTGGNQPGTDAITFTKRQDFPTNDRSVTVNVTDPNSSTPLGAGTGLAFFRVPQVLNGYKLYSVSGGVSMQSTSTAPITVQINNATQGNNLLSTVLSIDGNELDSITALTPSVVFSSLATVNTGDRLRVDLFTAGSSKARGLMVEMTFRSTL